MEREGGGGGGGGGGMEREREREREGGRDFLDALGRLHYRETPCSLRQMILRPF